MIEVVEWPGLDKGELFRFNKIINEPDFLPVHFVRVLLQGTKLVRVHRDKLVPTRLSGHRSAVVWSTRCQWRGWPSASSPTTRAACSSYTTNSWR